MKKNPFAGMEKHFRELDDKQINAGFFAESKYPLNSNRHKGVHVAQVAKWQNDGTEDGGGNIPKRPFMDLSALKIKESSKVRKALQVPVIKALRKTGSKVSKVLVAGLMRDIIKQEILDTSKPVNSPTTIALKGFDDPLIETGRMYDSVKGKVK